MKIFESLTWWQAEDYVIRVQAGIFVTREKADEFGRQPMKLERDEKHNRLVLFDAKTGEELDEAFDENIGVFKLKKSSRGKSVVNYDDYEQVHISIADFGNYRELSSFGSLAYGVNEATQLVISLGEGRK